MFTQRYTLAGFTVQITSMYAYIHSLCRPFIADSAAVPDISVTVTPADIALERTFVPSGDPSLLSEEYLEGVAIYRQLSLQLPAHDALIIHTAFISVAEHGVAFMAPSGVGKTTQVRLWQQEFGDAVSVINGDKPIVRFAEPGEMPMAYGTPWAGKENWYQNAGAPLTDIAFVQRSDVDYTYPLSAHEAVVRLLPQVAFPHDRASVIHALDLVEQLTDTCRFWVVQCTMRPSAARETYQEIVGGLPK